jgi:hypothetical protein
MREGSERLGKDPCDRDYKGSSRAGDVAQWFNVFA